MIERKVDPGMYLGPRPGAWPEFWPTRWGAAPSDVTAGARRSWELGPDGYRFLDWLATRGFSLWQILPLSLPGSEQCPYVSAASLALNPLLLDLTALVDEGLLAAAELPPPTPPGDWSTSARSSRGSSPRSIAPPCASSPNGAHSSTRSWQTTRGRWRRRSSSRSNKCTAASRGGRVARRVRGARHGSARAVRGGARRQNSTTRSGAAARRRAVVEAARVCARSWRRDRRRSADLRRSRLSSVLANRSLFLLHPDGSPRVVAGVPPDYFWEDSVSSGATRSTTGTSSPRRATRGGSRGCDARSRCVIASASITFARSQPIGKFLPTRPTRAPGAGSPDRGRRSSMR